MKPNATLESILGTVRSQYQLLPEDYKEKLVPRVDAFDKTLHEERYIKVPVVGNFSAGKSSMLNVFTGKKAMLPIDVMPTTAIACELYYGVPERVEQYREGTKIAECALRELASLSTEPGDLAKVYCDSSMVQELEEKGVVIVDMPGIGSGVERHDMAIAEYLQEGTAFVMVMDVDQGSLRGSSLAFMRELSGYGMHPGVLVSKADKKPEAEVQSVVEYIKGQIKAEGDANPFVAAVSAANGDVQALASYIDGLDVDGLLFRRQGLEMKVMLESMVHFYEERLQARRADVANIDAQIEALGKEIERYRKEAEAGLKAEGGDSVQKSTGDILERIEGTLRAHAGEVADMVMNNAKGDEIQAYVSGIVRSELYSSLKIEAKEFTDETIRSTAKELEHLKDVGIESNKWLRGLEDVLQVLLIVLPIPGGKIAALLKKFAKILFTALTGVLPFLKKTLSARQLEKVKRAFEETGISSIIVALQPAVLTMVERMQQTVKERVASETLERLENMKRALEEKIADKQRTKEEIAAECEKIEAAAGELRTAIVKLG